MEDITNLRKKVESYEMLGDKSKAKVKMSNTFATDVQKLADDA
jgi:hypothetical protein